MLFSILLKYSNVDSNVEYAFNVDPFRANVRNLENMNFINKPLLVSALDILSLSEEASSFINTPVSMHYFSWLYFKGIHGSTSISLFTQHDFSKERKRRMERFWFFNEITTPCFARQAFHLPNIQNFLFRPLSNLEIISYLFYFLRSRLNTH